MSESLSVVPVTKPSEKHLRKNRSFQGIPGIAVTEKGRIFTMCYSGGTGECRENYVVLFASDDNGETWTDAIAVVDPEAPEVRAYDETMWVAPDGRMYLFWAQTISKEPDHAIFDGIAGVWYSVLTNPDADIADLYWTQPVRICDGIMMNKPTVLADGTWALPVSVWKYTKAHPGKEGNEGTKMVVSEDNGKTFIERGKGIMLAEEALYDEHTFIELKDGRVMCVIRAVRGHFVMYSSDKGKTWTKPVRWHVTGPSSRMFIRRLQSGKLAMVYNDCPDKDPEGKDVTKREKMTAWLSDDEGQTWYGRLLLDGREDVSYPDGQQVADGRIYIVHDWGRYKGGEIVVSIITEEDIAAGKIVSAGSRLNIISSDTKKVSMHT